MSLLSNLLAFSSINSMAQKQQRSASANSRFFFETDEPQKPTESKQRVASKSLSKMGLLSNLNQPKVDPKYRCLHRIAHNLSMKVRKHYYALFVTLQTMKKNNVSLQKKPKKNMETLEVGIQKVEQTFSIRYMKQYENSYKTESFSKVKAYSEKMCLLKTLQKVCMNNDYRFCSLKLFEYFKELQKLSMKADLVEGSLQPVIKKCNMSCLKQSFKEIKQYKKRQNDRSRQKGERTVSIFQIYDNMQKKVENSNQKIKNSFRASSQMASLQQSIPKVENINEWNPLSNKGKNSLPKLEQSSLQSTTLNYNLQNSNSFQNNNRMSQSFQGRRQSFSYSKNFQDEPNLLATPYQSRFQSLQGSPIQKPYSKSKSPYRSCKKVHNLRQSLAEETLDSKTYQKVYKCYKITLELNQKSYQLPSKNESVPKKLHKMVPQQCAFLQVQDLADKSNIFRDFKSSKISAFDSLEISNVVGEPFMRAETMISDIQRNRQRFEDTTEKSQISYTPYLPNDASCSTINNYKEESNFGCDAVNFKNSLVLERQSMKRTEREKVDTMLKKRTILMGVEADHRSQQLQHLKNNKRKFKNEYSDRKISEQIQGNNFEQSYIFEPNYEIKRQNSNNFESYRPKNTGVMQSVYNGFNNWQDKKSHHEYNSEGKSKSFSFNSNSSDALSRRLRFTGELDKRTGDDLYPHNIYSSANSSFIDPMSWKNQLLENRSEMPVRDVGLDSYSKMRAKNSSTQSQLHTNKDCSVAPKKFINISKR